MNLILQRLGVQGSAMIGLLTVPGLDCPIWTLEDVPNNNLPGISCIPEGNYWCRPHGWKMEPVKFKKVWEVCNVPNRKAILFHSGNTDLDTHGCILVGFGVLRGRLLESKAAILSMQELIGPKEFSLQILPPVSA